MSCSLSCVCWTQCSRRASPRLTFLRDTQREQDERDRRLRQRVPHGPSCRRDTSSAQLSHRTKTDPHAAPALPVRHLDHRVIAVAYSTPQM
jgi:hypothetical protein